MDDFTFDVTEDNRVILRWVGQPDRVLTGAAAQAFLARIEGLDDRTAQMEVAKFVEEFLRDQK